MSRKSRKALVPTEISNLPTNTLYQTAIYARLSVFDQGHEKKNNDSIENQIEYLKTYINTNSDLQLQGIYCDNGFSGTNFKRPEWNKLMENVIAGKITCILVKDLSRMGRDYIETGNYLENIFPSLGTRIIAINDSYDSKDSSKDSECFRIALKNVVNYFYAKDISKKVATSSYLKQKKGDYQGAHPPFGYLYAKENSSKLEVDENTTYIVKQIFNWSLAGATDTEIVKRLNKQGVPTPNNYFYNIGLIQTERYAKKMVWQRSTIRRILENQVYTGVTIRGKTRESMYDNSLKHKVPEKDWIRIPNTHEGIIGDELFHKVQKLGEKAKHASCHISSTIERG